MVAAKGECPGCKHQASHHGPSMMLRLAIPPSTIWPCVNPEGCGVVIAELRVHAAREVIGDISLR